MLIFKEQPPRRLASAALLQAEAMPGEWLTGDDASLSAQALPIYMPNGPGAEDFEPDKLRRKGWRFLVTSQDRVVATVMAYVKEDGFEEIVGTQEVSPGSDFDLAIAAIDESLEDGAQEVKLIELPQLCANFIWLDSPRAKFIDVTLGRVYSVDEYRSHVRELWAMFNPEGPRFQPGRS